MIAIILAGGKGSRLKELGRGIPKPLIPIGDRPVINSIVDKLLELGGDCAVRRIYVLAKKDQRLGPQGADRARTLDLKGALSAWKSIWYGREDRVAEPLFEKDLPPRGPGKRPLTGAVVGLHRFVLRALGDGKSGGDLLLENEKVLVVAGDNYFEDSLAGLLKECQAYPNATFNAYKDLENHQKILNKYGCVKLAPNDKWVVGYKEKPVSLKADQTNASAGIYCFTYSDLMLLKEYVRRPQSKLDAPGYFLEWLVKRHHPQEATPKQGDRGAPGIRGYPLAGRWFDIGNPTDLKICLYWHLMGILSRFKTVEDLVIARDTERLDDQHFLLCHELEIDPSPGIRTVRLFFRMTHPVCRSSHGAGQALIVDDFRADLRQREAKDEWRSLQSALEGKRPFKRTSLKNPLLISAGVFLFDTQWGPQAGGRSRRLPPRSLIPLLEKDFGAPSDRRRLTTPSGRMDMLDLEAVCYAELCEELIFYGSKDPTGSTKLYYLTLARRDLDLRRKLLQRILSARLNIPGLSHDLMDRAINGKVPMDDIVEAIPLEWVELPEAPSWTVQTYLRDDRSPQPTDRLLNTTTGVVVITDPENATLEFRLVCHAALSKLPDVPPGTPLPADAACGRVGQLMGIADGDGYGRCSLLIEAAQMQRYHGWLDPKDPKKREEVTAALRNSQMDKLTALAVGDGPSGRFSRFHVELPPLPVTTSVKALMELLGKLA